MTDPIPVEDGWEYSGTLQEFEDMLEYAKENNMVLPYKIIYKEGVAYITPPPLIRIYRTVRVPPTFSTPLEIRWNESPGITK